MTTAPTFYQHPIILLPTDSTLLQVMILGPLAIIGTPFELTTMAGRRLRGTVQKPLQALGAEHIVLSGLLQRHRTPQSACPLTPG